MKRIRISLLMGGLATAWMATEAQAAQCGSLSSPYSGTCACGDTVVGTYTMSSNLTCNNADGLLVADDSTLDCDGKTIGSNSMGTHYGVKFNGVTNALVKDCIISSFTYGVLIEDGFDNVVQDSTITGGAGAQNAAVKIYGNADYPAGNLLSGLTINGTTYNGIMFENAFDNEVIDTEINFATEYSNSLGVYFKDSEGNLLTNVSAQAGVTLENASFNDFTNTDESGEIHGEIPSGDILITKASYENSFNDVDVLNGRVRILEAGGNAPDGNYFYDGSITKTTGNGSCVEHTRGGLFTLDNTTFGNCPSYDIDVNASSTYPATVQAISTDAVLSNSFVGDQYSVIEVGGNLNFTITHNSAPLGGAFVLVRDTSNNIVNPGGTAYVSSSTNGGPASYVAPVIHQKKTRVGSVVTTYTYGTHSVEAYTTTNGQAGGTKNWTSTQSSLTFTSDQDLNFTKP